MAIAVDIGTKNIKVCKVHAIGGVSAVACAVMSENVATGRPETDGVAAHKIREIIKSLPLASRSALISTGSSDMVTHNFSFPRMSPEELGGAVRFEAPQALSVDLRSMSTHYQVLSEIDASQDEVLYVAVPNQAINRLLRIASRGRIEVSAVDLDNLAIANCFTALEHDVEKQSAVILNIGYLHTNIVVMDAGKVRFVRNVPFGGQHITEAIAARYGVSLDTAEEIKRQSFLWNSMGLNIKNILRQCMPDLLEAVYRSIEYCMNRKRLLSVDRILLTGGTSNLTGLDRFVAEVFGIDTERWNPLDYIDVGEAGRKEYGQFMCVALGLALRAAHHA